MLRLFLFALISQVPFTLAFRFPDFYSHLNIFFTLCAGVLAIWFYDRSDSKAMGLGFIFMISAVAFIFQFDYIFYGIWAIALFYIYYDNKTRKLISFAVLNAVMLGYSLFNLFIGAYGPVTFGPVLVLALIQPLSLISLALIDRYNGLQGPKQLKYFFYAFYPLHLMVIWGVWYFFL
jgi:hypothetical protein